MSSTYGLLGEKLGHSLSPAIHSLIFKELGVDSSYNLFEVGRENLREYVLELRANGVKGLNVTIPYKIDVISFLDEISSEVQSIGASNTILFEDNKSCGYNTDYFGFGMTLKKYDIDITDKSVVVLGSGGAAKAVIQYLNDNGVGNITVASRNPLKLMGEFKASKVVSYDELILMGKGDIIINCTPLGMYPKVEDTPVKEEVIRKFQTAVDLIYNPEETVFLRLSRQNGLKTANGLTMLIGQAVRSQEIWNGIKIGEEVTNKIYRDISNMIRGERK